MAMSLPSELPMTENPPPLSWRRAAMLGLIFALAVSFGSFWISDLTSGDETRVAGICAEMALQGGWIVPKLNGHPFLEYPPLYYNIAAVMMRLFGISSFTARFPAALALFLAGMTGFLFAGRLRFSPLAALAAEGMILTNFSLLKMGRRAMVDMQLAFCILLATAAFYAMRTAEGKGKRFLWFLLFAGALTAGGYTKGLLGAGLPAVILGVWILWCGIIDRKFPFAACFALGTATLAALVMMALWYWALARLNGEHLHTAVIVNNLYRFSGKQGDHVTPWFYYLPRLPQMFQPYLIFFLAALWKFRGKLFRQKEKGMILLFIASWLPLFLLSFSAAKRPVYLLPSFCFWALFTAPLADEIPSLAKRFFAPRPLMPILCRIAGIAIAAVVVFDFCYAGYVRRTDGMAACFRYLRKAENEGKQLILINPQERTQGAVWFYLHHGAPERRMRPDAMKTGPNASEIWFWRDKRNDSRPPEQRWPDGHRSWQTLESVKNG